MSKRQTIFLLQTVTLASLAVFSLAACSKTNDQAATSRPPASADIPVVATTTPNAPPAMTIVPSTDIRKSLAAVDTAMKNRAYVIAVQEMLAVQQQKQMTDQEAQEAHNRMVGLQSSLATSIANGDANARAAAELLRQSVMR